MSTSPDPGITVYTTTGNTYTAPGGDKAETAVTPTGELYAEVFGTAPDGGDAPWLGSFGSVEAVYKNGAVTAVPPTAASRGGL